MAFFFTGGDAYGRSAKAYVAAYYPNHLRFEATSFEGMFEILGREVARLQKRAGDVPVHVDEIILVSHANAGGGMKIPLVAGGKRRFSPSDVEALQGEADRGLHKRFLATRAKALGGIDEETRIVVRGCELGKDSDDPLDALSAMFGGRPRAYAPKAFQGFSVETIGKGARLKTPVEAFDWLMQAGYLSHELAEFSADEKKKHIEKYFRLGIPTDWYLVGEDNYKAFKAMGVKDKLGEKGEDVKRRDTRPTAVDESKAGDDGGLWRSHSRRGRRDTELAIPRVELVGRAEALWAAYTPDKAGMFLRLWRAWGLAEGEGGAIRTGEIDTGAVLERTPAIFSDENLRRARRDAVLHPDASQDVLGPGSGTKLHYGAKDARAGDFSMSEGTGAVVDPVIEAAARAAAARKRAAAPKPLTNDSATLFMLGLQDLTTAGVLRRAPLPGTTATGDHDLDATLGEIRYVVQSIRSGIGAEHIKGVIGRWRMCRPGIDRVQAFLAGAGFDVAQMNAGRQRVEDSLDRAEVSARSRAAEKKVRIAQPDIGIWEGREINELIDLLTMNSRLHVELKTWDARHAVRGATTAVTVEGGALKPIGSRVDLAGSPRPQGAFDDDIRAFNNVRIAIGLLALFQELGDLDRVMDEAAKRGLLARTATASKFVSHATTVTTESINVMLRAAASRADAWAALAKGTPYFTSFAEQAAKFRVAARGLTAGAGAVAVVAGILDLIDNWGRDERAARSAAHSTAQGLVNVGAGLLDASAGATTFVSGTLVVAWATLEAIAIGIDNIKGFKKLQELEVVRRDLERAATLIPWGKKMAGVGDAYNQVEAEDPDRAFALADRFIAAAAQPYSIVAPRLYTISRIVEASTLAGPLSGPERQAINELETFYGYRKGDPFTPWQIGEMTQRAVVLYEALQRMGRKAIAVYGRPIRGT
ncbi:MAG: hypothetical protein ACXWYS_01555 [Gaiellaceae bacterium]